MSNDRPVATLPFELNETCYVMMREPIDLQLRITTENGPDLPRMMGDGETLDALLYLAVDGAAAKGDEAGLVLLRECLIKYTAEAQSALQEIIQERTEQDFGDLWVAP